MDVRLQSCQMELMQFARGGDRVGRADGRWGMAVRTPQWRSTTQRKCNATLRKGRIKRPCWHSTYSVWLSVQY